MVIVSHDRQFLDNLCTKIVETERGVSTTYKGNYSEYVKQKDEAVARQWAAWEKQQKEIARQVGAASVSFTTIHHPPSDRHDPASVSRCQLWPRCIC